jgi:autotransporter-associated beta strand protein
MKNTNHKSLVSRLLSTGIPLRKLTLAVGVLLAAAISPLQAQLTLPLYEPFNYPNNERLGTSGSSGTNWSIGLNSTGTGSTVTTNGITISYPSLKAPTGIVLWFSPTTPSSGRNRGMPFTSQTLSDSNPTLYYSFLLNVQANPSGLEQIFALSSSSSSLSSPMTVFLTPEGKMALGKNSTTAATVTNAAALSAGTHLIVVRYKYTSGTANDEYALWIDPTALGVNEASVPAATIATTSGSDFSAIASIAVVHQTTPSPPGNFYVDELRVAKTWAEVTPVDCTPPTAYSVTGGGGFCPGDAGVSVGLANSQTGVEYRLRRNGTDLGVVSNGTDGIAIDFGLQNVAGTYTVLGSNTTTMCAGLMNGSAVVAANTAPNITSAPTDTTNYIGGSQTFTIVATGAGLTYQWRTNGVSLVNGGNISGATSNILTISPVASEDAASYDCVVSGTCSPAQTSTPAAVLTVKLPNNLTWVGDSLSNLWDTTSANWAGGATVFSPGDNVRIDDSGSATPAIDLVGTITPSFVVVSNVTKDYTIGTTAGGSLGGQASLTKDGAGKLTLGTVNSFTGKTTVKGGTISVPTASSLGAAPASFTADQLTLDGGTIQYTTTGSINANRGTTLGPAGGTFDIPSGILFTNSPAIAGPGSLTKVNSGTLRLAVANTYAGGTTLAGGTLDVGNGSALGSGSVTLGGGTLSFAAATTIANNVSVSASSTITFGTTGNSAVVLNGDLTGAAGTLLTITPTGSSTASTRVRLGSSITNTFTYDGDIALNGTFTFATYNSQGVQTYNGLITGAGLVGRRSTSAGIAGVTILNNANTYGGGTIIADGAIGFGVDSAGSPTVTSGPIGTGSLSFENNPGTLHRLFASGGPRIVGNPIVWPSGANQDLTIEGGSALTLTGTMDLGGSTRTICASNTANTVLSGALSNGGLVKTGPGVLVLDGINTYTGSTTVSNGTLGGTGTLAGPVIVVPGANLAPGSSIGTLTINGDLSLGGTFTAEVNSTNAQTADLVTGIGTVTYGGTLAIVNLGPDLTAANSFLLFSATARTGAFQGILPATPGAGLVWNTNTLTADGILRIATAGPPSAPTNITFSVSGGNLTVSWPQDYTGWTLQAQTNPLGIGTSTNWADLPGSSTTNTLVIPIDTNEPAVFFRMKLAL